jgi:pimeloyl-ACP methyl ester carboxylesterase
VVLLHGITGSWRSFEPLLPHLPRTFNAFAVTLRGHGGSDKPDGPYSVKAFADDVDAFMSAAGVASAIVVGHSMSSAVALQLALDYPERVRGLVLMGGTAAWPDNGAAAGLGPIFLAMRDPIDPQFVREFQASTAASPVPGIIETATSESLRVPARVWAAAASGLLAFDARGRLGEIGAPTLILWGDKENIVTRAEQDVLAAGIRGARLVTMDGLGHALHWDAPDRVAAELAALARQIGS